MISIHNPSQDPPFNLALEEYFLRQTAIEEEIVILWQNRPAIIIGKNQNTRQEINEAYVRDHHIEVVRRLSGGGAVYHDLGNLNFTFIANCPNRRHDFRYFTVPVLAALAELGIKAECNGRNDLTIEGRKFSGNAQYFSRNRLLHHGTLLFATDTSVLSQALNVKEQKYSSKGVKSVQSRVVNISEYLPASVTLADFQELLCRHMFLYRGEEYRQYQLSSEDKSAIEQLADRQYRTEKWNYGASPPANFQQERTFAGGTVALYLEINGGVIRHCKICGDFFENEALNGLETAITGCRYEQAAVTTLLTSLDAGHFFHNISTQEFISCFFPE